MAKQPSLRTIAFCCFVVLLAGRAAAQQPTSAPSSTPQGTEIPGATNFTRLAPGFASGGVTTPSAFALLGQMGFHTVINLRTADEQGADLDGEAVTVREAGMKYLSLPFSPVSPDASMVDKFLDAVQAASAQPIYIHCRSGARANAFWLIKRVLVDQWTVDKALVEADTLRLTDERLRKFALAYIDEHKKLDAGAGTRANHIPGMCPLPDCWRISSPVMVMFHMRAVAGRKRKKT